MKDDSNSIETVLVLQGGGSLGAYECGVYKALSKQNIKFDIIVGTSIGAINASIITGSTDDASKKLEEFWLELSENITSTVFPLKMRSYFSTFYASVFGNPNVALPINNMFNPWMMSMYEPYIYDNKPLKNILSRYVDFAKINNSNTRLIVTSVDIKQGKSISFDSNKSKIDVDHIMASAGYPFYGISWTKKDGRYLWDGSLLSNTPVREAIDASPKCDKIFYIIDLFPRIHNELPKNMIESWHRARDIMHADKTEHNVKMSKVISRYLKLINKMHDILQNTNLDEKARNQLNELESEYSKITYKRGAIIQDIIRIERQEDSHFLLEDVDFSEYNIKQLIKKGESDARRVLQTRKSTKI